MDGFQDLEGSIMKDHAASISVVFLLMFADKAVNRSNSCLAKVVSILIERLVNLAHSQTRIANECEERLEDSPSQ